MPRWYNSCVHKKILYRKVFLSKNKLSLREIPIHHMAIRISISHIQKSLFPIFESTRTMSNMRIDSAEFSMNTIHYFCTVRIRSKRQEEIILFASSENELHPFWRCLIVDLDSRESEANESTYPFLEFCLCEEGQMWMYEWDNCVFFIELTHQGFKGWFICWKITRKW